MENEPRCADVGARCPADCSYCTEGDRVACHPCYLGFNPAVVAAGFAGAVPDQLAITTLARIEATNLLPWTMSVLTGIAADRPKPEHSALASRIERIERLSAESPIVVRIGEAPDWPQIAALARRAFDESADSGFGFDPAKVDHMGQRCIDPACADLGIVAVHRETGRIVGFLYATAGTHLFAPVSVAVCQVIYVVPEYRWSMAPFALLRSFIKRAVAGGASLASVHVTSGIRVRATHRFLTKMYFTHVGGNYLLPLRRPAAAGDQPPKE